MKLCRNTFLAEHHRTTASDYSSSNSREGRMANETVNYDTKTESYVQSRVVRAVQVKEQVSEEVVRRLQISCS